MSDFPSHTWEGFKFEFVEPGTHTPLLRSLMTAFFEEHFTYRLAPLFSDEEKDGIRYLQDLASKLSSYQLLVWDVDTPIAWSVGHQVNAFDYYMTNSGVIPSYRHRGIYTHLLSTVVAHLQSLGVQRIRSHHHTDNNAVLIPKLKAGFTICGMEIDDRFGTVVELQYLTNPVRRNLFSIRTGSRRPDADTNALLP